MSSTDNSPTSQISNKSKDFSSVNMNNTNVIDPKRDRYPYCLVWTPIPILTWLLPFVGHLGIGLSSGVIRDFAGPYFVSEDNFAFGKPTKYWQLDPTKVPHGHSWDMAISEASEVYKGRMHNLCCDNCHSHVGMALTLMRYDDCVNWGMVKLAFLMLVHGKYVNVWGFLKTWVPFLLLILLAVFISFLY